MKKKKNNKQTVSAKRHQSGLPEFLVAVSILVLIFIIALCIRSCEMTQFGKDIITDDTSVDEPPSSTVLTPVATDEVLLPFSITGSITLDQIYTATGCFPEDGTDEAAEDVLAVKLTNAASKTLEYLTFTLTLNGEDYLFTAATVPTGKSVYAFNTERKTAPDSVTSIDGSAEVELYFKDEPSPKTETLSYEIQNGTVIVTNITEEDIRSDIMVYYKSTVDGGYLGGITYRFRINGGLSAGQSFNSYAPHARSRMTEIMFVQYEE